MPSHHSQAGKHNRAVVLRKTRYCRYFFTEEGCKNSASCAFAHSAEEIQTSPLFRDIPSAYSFSEDSTSVCSEETSLSSVWSAETLPQYVRQCWADAKDEEDDKCKSLWAPGGQPDVRTLSKVRTLSIATLIPPTPAGAQSAAITKAAATAGRREAAAAAAKAKRAALAGAVLEGLLRQAQGPDVYQD